MRFSMKGLWYPYLGQEMRDESDREITLRELLTSRTGKIQQSQVWGWLHITTGFIYRRGACKARLWGKHIVRWSVSETSCTIRYVMLLRSWLWTPTDYLFLLSNLSTFYLTTWPPCFTQSHQYYPDPYSLPLLLLFIFVHRFASIVSYSWHT